MIALYGKVEEDQRSRELQIVQPQFEILGDPTDSGENGARRKESCGVAGDWAHRSDLRGDRTADAALVPKGDPHRARQSDA